MTRGLNKVMIIGNLGRDPEMKFTTNGKSVANFTIASNRSWKSNDGNLHTETDWFNVVAWSKLAEFAKEYMIKGSLVYVEGRLQSYSRQDHDGNKHRSIEIIAQNLLLLSDTHPNNESNDSEDTEEYPF